MQNIMNMYITYDVKKSTSNRYNLFKIDAASAIVTDKKKDERSTSRLIAPKMEMLTFYICSIFCLLILLTTKKMTRQFIDLSAPL